MPGRKVTPVHSLFTVTQREGMKVKRAKCKFCFEEVSDNGTRKLAHIQQCLKCPDDVKFKYLSAVDYKAKKGQQIPKARRSRSTHRGSKLPDPEAGSSGTQSETVASGESENVDVIAISNRDVEGEGRTETFETGDKNPAGLQTHGSTDEINVHQPIQDQTQANTSMTSQASGSSQVPEHLAPIFSPDFHRKSPSLMSPPRSRMSSSSVALNTSTPKVNKGHGHQQASLASSIDKMSTFQNVSLCSTVYL